MGRAFAACAAILLVACAVWASDDDFEYAAKGHGGGCDNPPPSATSPSWMVGEPDNQSQCFFQRDPVIAEFNETLEADSVTIWAYPNEGSFRTPLRISTSDDCMHYAPQGNIVLDKKINDVDNYTLEFGFPVEVRCVKIEDTWIDYWGMYVDAVGVRTNATDIEVVELKFNSSDVEPGENVTAIVVVKNRRNNTVDGVVVRIERQPSNGDVVSNMTSGRAIAAPDQEINLSGKENRTLHFQFAAPLGAGAYEYTATADPDGTIKETNETNNYKKASLRVFSWDWLGDLASQAAVAAAAVLILIAAVAVLIYYSRFASTRRTGPKHECSRCGASVPAHKAKCPVCSAHLKN